MLERLRRGPTWSTSPNSLAHDDAFDANDYAEIGVSSIGTSRIPVFVFGPDRPFEDTNREIVQTLRNENVILIMAPGSAPKHVLIPVLQAMKGSLENQNIPRKPSLLVMTDTPVQMRVRAQFIQFGAGLRSAKTLSVSVIPEVTSDENRMKEAWRQAMAKDVVVASPEVLESVTVRGILSMTQLRCIILLDGVNVRDGHQLAPLLHEYYCPLPENDRPRIFGIYKDTNLPVYFDTSCAAMERALYAKILGVPSSERQSFLAESEAQKEIIVAYNSEIDAGDDSQIFRIIHRLDPDERYFNLHFAAARQIASDMGKFASTLVWKNYMATIADNTGRRQPDDGDASHYEVFSARPPHDLEKAVSHCIASQNFSIDSFGTPGRFSDKFLKLVHVLRCCALEDDGFRCLILVKRKSTAIVLFDLLRFLAELELPSLKPQVLLSSRRSDQPEEMDCRLNKKRLKAFRKGRTNVLITTSLGEDSLDLPRMSCVIRWDFPESFTAYGHTKARLRPTYSYLVLMHDKGNLKQKQVIQTLRAIPPAWSHWISTLDGPCRNLPPSDMVFHPDIRLPSGYDEMDVDPSSSCILDLATGARFPSEDSIYVLYRYCAGLNANLATQTTVPLLKYDVRGGTPNTFTCTVNFPRHSPIGTISGPPCRTKADARRLACYRACQELYRQRLLDVSMFPRPILSSFCMAAEDLAKFRYSNTQVLREHLRDYTRIRRTLSQRVTHDTLDSLYPTVVVLEDPRGYTPIITHDSQVNRSLCLLTRRPLPSIPPFDLSVRGTAWKATFHPFARLELSQPYTKSLHVSTRLFYQIILQKSLQVTSREPTFLVAPLLPTWRSKPRADVMHDSTWPFHSILKYIAWDEVHQMTAADGKLVALTSSPDPLRRELVDALLDEGPLASRGPYRALGLRADLSPSSPIPGAPLYVDASTALGFYNDTASGPISVRDLGQPLIEATPVAPSPEDLYGDGSVDYVYLIPELHKRYPVSASIYYTGLALPAILHRIDDLLLAKELNAGLLENRLQDNTLLEALTTTSAGQKYNYERMEFFGDAVLEYLVSVYGFVYGSDANSEQLASMAAGMVKNRTLWQAGIRHNIPQYIVSEPFVQEAWFPEGFAAASTVGELGRKQQDGPKVSRKQGKEAVGREDSDGAALDNVCGASQPRRLLPDKCIADVIEAIIGAAFLSGGLEGAFRCCKNVGLSFFHAPSWADLTKGFVHPTPTSPLTDAVDGILQAIDVKLSRPEWLAVAFLPSLISGNGSRKSVGLCNSHRVLSLEQFGESDRPDAVGERGRYWDRLIFLGEAVYRFVVTEHMYRTDQKGKSGSMSTLRQMLTAPSFVGAVAEELELLSHARDPQTASAEVYRYREALRVAHESEVTRPRSMKDPIKDWWEGIEAPQAVCDLVKVLFGVLAVSEDFDLRGAQTVYEKLVWPFFDAYTPRSKRPRVF